MVSRARTARRIHQSVINSYKWPKISNQIEFIRFVCIIIRNRVITYAWLGASAQHRTTNNYIKCSNPREEKIWNKDSNANRKWINKLLSISNATWRNNNYCNSISSAWILWNSVHGFHWARTGDAADDEWRKPKCEICMRSIVSEKGAVSLFGKGWRARDFNEINIQFAERKKKKDKKCSEGMNELLIWRFVAAHCSRWFTRFRCAAIHGAPSRFMIIEQLAAHRANCLGRRAVARSHTHSDPESVMQI